jgi:hypothetical protein
VKADKENHSREWLEGFVVGLMEAKEIAIENGARTTVSHLSRAVSEAQTIALRRPKNSR